MNVLNLHFFQISSISYSISSKSIHSIAYILVLTQKITMEDFEIIKSNLKQSEILSQNSIKCPICKSLSISLIKGDGESIIGCDITAIACHSCKKIFEFSDIVYKNNK